MSVGPAQSERFMAPHGIAIQRHCVSVEACLSKFQAHASEPPIRSVLNGKSLDGGPVILVVPRSIAVLPERKGRTVRVLPLSRSGHAFPCDQLRLPWVASAVVTK